MKNSTKGITLVALVVTIVVLLILAGVTITYTMGDKSIFKKAQEAKIATEQATVLEKMRTKIFEVEFEEIKQGKEVDEYHYLQTSDYIDANGIVNIATLFPQFATGKGSMEQGDCYYVSDGKLYYTSDEKAEKYLGDLFEKTETVPELKWIWHTEGEFAVIDGIDHSYFNEYRYDEWYINYFDAKVVDYGIQDLEFPEELGGKKVKSVSLEVNLLNETREHSVLALLFEGIEKIIVPTSCEQIIFDDDHYPASSAVHFRNLKEIVCPDALRETALKAWGECALVKEGNGRRKCNCRPFSELKIYE